MSFGGDIGCTCPFSFDVKPNIQLPNNHQQNIHTESMIIHTTPGNNQ